MKILYISDGGSTCDYLRDMAAHGLRTLFGPDFVDIRRLDTLYSDYPQISALYGRGFTLYGLLPDIEVDRTDIPHKISTRYFDLIIYGSIHRNQDYLSEVASQYQAPRVIFLDGEDHPGYLSGLGGLTFKRELYNPQPGCLPISFAIPREKILSAPWTKSRLLSPCDPVDKRTYIYETERSYYAQYADSYYASTMKKAGWDCLRHYEIMANWCLPYFRVFDQCPPTICQHLPRPELLLVKSALELLGTKSLTGPSYRVLTSLYECLIEPVMSILKEKLTTDALAVYILDSIGTRKRGYTETADAL